MKSEGEVRQKLKQVIFRHLKKHLHSRLREYPDNCRHNSEMEPRDRHEEAFGVQACFYTQDGVPRGVICDARYDNGFRAKDCPLFESRYSKDDLKADFRALIESEEKGPLAAEYPDIAALMWVLDETPSEDLTEEVSETEMAQDEDVRGWRWPWSRRKS